MDSLYIAILALGALGSFVFVVDYLRTANLDLPYTRLILTLNFAIAAILGLATLSRLGFVEFTPFLAWIHIMLLVIVDVTIWYQLVLLRRIRKVNDRIFEKIERKKKRNNNKRPRPEPRA